MMKARRRFYTGLGVFLVVVATAVLVAVFHIDWTRSRFPGEHWDHIAPEQAGFAPDLLAEFVREVGGHGLVVRYGYVVTWWGRYARPLDVASGCKPVYAHIVYAAIRDGLIGDLDEKVSPRVPELDLIGESPDVHYGQITWRHLLQQTACYGVEERPGTAFNYSDYQAALLADTIVFGVHNTVYGRADREILEKYLAGPLEFQDHATLTHKRSHLGRLRISARDFARFGLLYLNRGKWKGRQCIPRELAIQAVSSPIPHDFPRTDQVMARMIEDQRSLGAGTNMESHMGSYSYTWWVNGEVRKGCRLFPDLPADTFLAQGHSGHDVLLVIPSLDLVVCWIDAFPRRRHAARFSADGHELVYAAARKLISTMSTPEGEQGR
jgi:CubicO group peptidase (beta-lactamase class C family)